MNTKLLLLLSIILFAGCIRETLDPCPTGDVKVNVYVEKFQAATHDYGTDMEASFNTRIQDIHYFLYKDNALIEEGRITDCTPFVAPPYAFERKGLDFGDYSLILVSNYSAPIGGNAPTELVFNYGGVDNKEDHFAVYFPFRVDCDCESEYNTYMERAHGVIRYTFHDIPQELSGIEITMTNVGNKKMIAGEYSGQTEVVKFIPVTPQTRANNAEEPLTVVLGTFPTAAGSQSAYHIRLFKNGEDEPYYNETVTDKLTIQRNQLLDIVTRFMGDIPSFEIRLDTAWDGSNSGGNTDIN